MFDVSPDTGDQSAAANSHVDGIRWFLALPHDLQANGPLARDHFGVIEWVDVGETLLRATLSCLCRAFVIGLAMEHHLPPQGADSAHLHFGSGGRHHDDGAAAELPCTQSHPLGMVPGARGDHTAAQLLLGELGHAVVSTTQLEGEHRLKVLAFQQHLIAESATEVGGWVKRRLPRDVVDASPKDPLEIVGHPSILPMFRANGPKERTP